MLEGLLRELRDTSRYFLASMPAIVRLAVEAEVRSQDWELLGEAQRRAVRQADCPAALCWGSFQAHMVDRVRHLVAELPKAAEEARKVQVAGEEAGAAGGGGRGLGPPAVEKEEGELAGPDYAEPAAAAAAASIPALEGQGLGAPPTADGQVTSYEAPAGSPGPDADPPTLPGPSAREDAEGVAVSDLSSAHPDPAATTASAPAGVGTARGLGASTSGRPSLDDGPSHSSSSAYLGPAGPAAGLYPSSAPMPLPTYGWQGHAYFTAHNPYAMAAYYAQMGYYNSAHMYHAQAQAQAQVRAHMLSQQQAAAAAAAVAAARVVVGGAAPAPLTVPPPPPDEDDPPPLPPDHEAAHPPPPGELGGAPHSPKPCTIAPCSALPCSALSPPATPCLVTHPTSPHPACPDTGCCCCATIWL